MIGTISHIVFCLVAQVVIAHFTGNYWLGAITGTCYYLGREVSQAEDRWNKAFGSVYGGTFLAVVRAFDPRAWDVKGLADWILPMIATGAVAYLV